MLQIAIVDDREDLRKSLVKPIKRYLKRLDIKWEVKDYPPLQDIKAYPNWIVSNKIIVLIVDEKLKGQSNNGYRANYNGHDLVKIIRKINNELPIYAVTAYPKDSALQESKGNFDDIIGKNTFKNSSELEQYMKRFVRATKTYLENYESEYSMLSKLSQLVALDKATEKDYELLMALQSKLGIPVSSFAQTDRKEWMENLEKKADELKKISDEIKKLLKK